MKMCSFRSLLVVVALILVSGHSQGQILLNGSFEDPQTSTSYSGGGTAWNASPNVSVFSNSANIAQTPYGTQYLALEPGAFVSQTITGFIAGQTYVLGADFANFANVPLPDASFTLSVSGAATGSQTMTAIDTTGGAINDTTFLFQSNVLIFTATSTGSATITLASTGNGDSSGLAIDNVALYGNVVVPNPSTPEPSTYAEMLLGIAALVGFARFRFRRRHCC